jgi:uncharacterized protein (TIGR02118 family)
MIKVSFLYPNTDGSRFDMEYYLSTHIPMIQQKLGAACKGLTAEAGLSGFMPGSRAPYVAMLHLLFDSVEAFQVSFGPHVRALQDDLPNYTDIQPIGQISEVKM